MKTIKAKLVDGGDMSADVTSGAVNLQRMVGAAVQLLWTAGATGTLYTQVSIDGTNWETADSEALAGSAGTKIVNIIGGYYTAVRVFYDATSGSGTLNAFVSAKGA